MVVAACPSFAEATVLHGLRARRRRAPCVVGVSSPNPPRRTLATPASSWSRSSPWPVAGAWRRCPHWYASSVSGRLAAWFVCFGRRRPVGDEPRHRVALQPCPVCRRSLCGQVQFAAANPDPRGRGGSPGPRCPSRRVRRTPAERRRSRWRGRARGPVMAPGTPPDPYAGVAWCSVRLASPTARAEAPRWTAAMTTARTRMPVRPSFP